jgi:hypothetical protein
MIRSKDGNNMIPDSRDDLIAVRVLDAQTQERLFSQDMFIALNGKQKRDVTTQQGYDSYRHRYDIESYFRFAKQKLFCFRWNWTVVSLYFTLSNNPNLEELWLPKDALVQNKN